eukprot:6661737-Prymnesium_polylepis.1
MPSRGNLSIASACSGMSGRVNASGAGDKSSVFVSPVTLNTVTEIFSGTSGFEKNHSASAHACITDCAAALPALAFPSTCAARKWAGARGSATRATGGRPAAAARVDAVPRLRSPNKRAWMAGRPYVVEGVEHEDRLAERRRRGRRKLGVVER